MNRNTVDRRRHQAGLGDAAARAAGSELRALDGDGGQPLGPQRHHGLEGRQRVGREPDRLQLPRRLRQRRQRDLVERRRRQRQGRRLRLLGSYLTATSTFFNGRARPRAPVRDLLQQLERRHLGSDLRQQLQRLGLLHRRLPAGLQPDRQPRLGAVQRARLLGLELGRAAADRELRVRPQPGRLRHQQPERRQPAAAERLLPGRRQAAGHGRTHSCWVFIHNYVHDNNNPNVPAAGSPRPGRSAPGCRCRAVATTRSCTTASCNNSAWGVIVVPYPDSGPPCTGGTPNSPVAGSCLYDEWGVAVLEQHLHEQRLLRQSDQRGLRPAEPEAAPDATASPATPTRGGRLTTSPASAAADLPEVRRRTVRRTSTSPFLNEVAVRLQLSSSARVRAARRRPLPAPHQGRHAPAAQRPDDDAQPVPGVPANPWCPRRSQSHRS